ncbi:MAG: sensor histidine kinase [Pseudomonadota bacterium]
MRSKRFKAASLIALGISPLALLSLVHRLDTPNHALDEYRVETVRLVESHSPTPPLDANWEVVDAETPVVVPIRRETFNSAWIAIDPPLGSGNLAVYLPYPKANVAVFLGDEYVDSAGPMQRPLHYHNRSLLFRLPADAAASGKPLYLRIARERGNLNSNGIILGPSSLMVEQYTSDRVITFWLPLIVAILMLGPALSLAVLYFMSRRHYAYFGLYALIVTLWSMHTLHSLINHVPIYHWAWIALIYLLLWWAVLTPTFANRFFALGFRRLEIASLVAGAVLTVPVFYLLATFQIEPMYDYFATVWVPYVLLCSVVTFALYAIASWRLWSFESLSLYFISAAGLIVGIRDHLYDFATWVPGTTFYTKYIAMGQVAIITLLIARRYARSERALVTLNRDLERRIDDKARELEAGYEERRDLERRQTLSDERNRLMRDMHDGLGGQLIQALAVSERENAPDELRDSLERALVDLRLIVDSISPQQSDLVSLLASFRHRSKRIWDKSGVNLKWDMSEVPAVSLHPEESLHVLRIVQEASTNALRHSGAQNVAFSAHASDGEVTVCIRDDGKGFDPDAEQAGFGIENMRRRAALAGVELDIDSGANGTAVRIRFAAEPES